MAGSQQEQILGNRGHGYVTGQVRRSSPFSVSDENYTGAASPLEEKVLAAASNSWGFLASWPKKHPTALFAVLAMCGGIAIGWAFGLRSR